MNKLVAYRRISNDANGNPRFVLHVSKMNNGAFDTVYYDERLKWSHTQHGYIVTSYNIEYQIVRLFPDCQLWKM